MGIIPDGYKGILDVSCVVPASYLILDVFLFFSIFIWTITPGRALAQTATKGEMPQKTIDLQTNNTQIPVIVTDGKDNISSAINVDFDTDTVKFLTRELKKEFTVHEPIVVNYYRDLKLVLYYKDSKLFKELRNVLDDLIESFISEVVLNSASVPVIITDSTKTNIIDHGNIDTLKIKDEAYIKKMEGG